MWGGTCSPSDHSTPSPSCFWTGGMAAQLKGGSDVLLEEGTCGLGKDVGSASRAAAPRTLTTTPLDKSGFFVIQIVQVMGASDTSQQTPTGSEMGSQVPIAIHRPLSEYAELKVLRVARRAIRQFYRDNFFYCTTGQVITSEAQLAVLFGERVVDKVRATITANAQQTPQGHQEKTPAPLH